MEKYRLAAEALRLAIHAHQGQKDLGGEEYIKHPIEIGFKAKTADEMAVGFLHDVIEDTEYTKEDLLKIFPKYIVDAVVAISKIKGEPYSEYLKRVKANQIACQVKIYDLHHNMNLSRLQNADDEIIMRISKKIFKKYIPALKYLGGWNE